MMKKYFGLTLLLLLVFVANASAQRPAPTATPADTDDVVKISTSLIQFDVTVTDFKGKPVTDLKPEDFEIFENGERQTISNVTFVAGARRVTEAERREKAGPEVPLPPSEVRPENVRRTISLVVDDLTLSFGSVYQTRRALRKFVDEQMQEGDLVAIIRTAGGMGALQQFTTDKRQLHAAIDRLRWNPAGRGGIGAFAPIEPTPSELLRASGDSSVSDADITSERNSMQSFDDFQGSLFATGTLGALRFIVTGMGELPGRKSVIMFSDGFKICESPTGEFVECGRVLEFLKLVVEAANRASVVVYTIDARGLETTEITAADKIMNPTPQSIEAVSRGRRNLLHESQGGLAFLSKGTGGIAIYNTNSLSGGVQRALDDQSYYLIGYTPDSDTFDAAKRKFNNIEIKVKRPDVTVRYRSGFFNVPEETRALARNDVKLTPNDALNRALSSPFAINDIGLNMNPIFGNDPVTGSYVRSLLHVNARDLTFVDQPDGKKKLVFNVLAGSFDENGTPSNQLGKTYDIEVSQAGYQSIVRDGFVYQFTFPVKQPGPYQYRVAIRDTASGRIGSASGFIDVPNLKKRLALSGLVLQSYTPSQWQKLNAGLIQSPAEPVSSTVTDTSLRRFKVGTILQYGFEIYGSGAEKAAKPVLATQLRVFRDKELVMNGEILPLDLSDQPDLQRIKTGGAISLLDKMTPGDYVLQVVVYEGPPGSKKRRIVTQYIQFELLP